MNIYRKEVISGINNEVVAAISIISGNNRIKITINYWETCAEIIY